jgi:hypothetical protein
MIRKWILKFELEIIVSLVIAVVSLYVLYFGKYIGDKPINVLLALAAVVSSMFLWLAFRESRRGNNLIICQKLYDEFWFRIDELEKAMNTQVFDKDESFNRNYFNIPSKITYNAFESCLISILNSINKGIDDHNVYSKNWNTNTESGAFFNMQNFISDISQFKRKIGSYSDYCFEILSVYKKIDKSNLDLDQKSLLIERLYPLSSGYINFYVKIKKKEYSQLKDLSIPDLKANGENQWKVTLGNKIIPAAFYVPFNSIDELNSKYIKITK